MSASILDPVMFSVGLLAVLRSKSHGGRTIGVMVTASHNLVQDNGVKLVEPLGEMLAPAWEDYATRLANAADASVAVAVLEEVLEAEKITFDAAEARVCVARDTRPSGEALVASLIEGIKALGGSVSDYGVLTTPQLHYVTRCLNTQGTPAAYGVPTEEGYYQKLAAAFKSITAGLPTPSKLLIDGANGVGAIAAPRLATHLGSSISYELVNGDTENFARLNMECGADYVKINQRGPVGLDLKPGVRACSLDGDADRIVYYYADDAGHFKLLDGDKIATLAASFIMELVATAKVDVARPDGTRAPLRVGLVQTAYANGSSTAYVKESLKVPVVFTPTGVKHLHHAAEEFDVGVYFEANGHGTVLFSAAAVTAFREKQGTNEAERAALSKLRSLTELINQAVGDALSDMLMVEAVLACQHKSLQQWDTDYTDLPSRQEKVKVSNRHAFVPIKADTELSAPAGLQDKINQQVARFNKGRCFV
ncbi:Phosphoacetylglucosamine Mutase, partial [Cladochytrium tenue]